MSIRFTLIRPRAAQALLLSAAALTLAACVVEPARPPRPAPLVEVVPARPAPEYHWVKGHYVWVGNHWNWVRGHWVLD